MVASTVPAMNFVPKSPFLGMQKLTESSSTKRHPLGTLVKGVDDYYGEATFIYVVGVASAVVGDLLVYDSYGATTIRATTASTGAIGIVMAATLGASTYGWLLVRGSGLSNAKTSTAAGPGYVSDTAGSISSTKVTGQLISNLKITIGEGANSPYAGTGKAVVSIQFPSCDNLKTTTIT